MIKIFLLIFINIFMFADSTTTTFGVLIKKFHNNNYLELIINVIEKNFQDKNHTIKVKIKIYKNKDLLFNDLRNEKLKGIIINPFIYFENKKIVHKLTKDRWSLSFNNQDTEEYYLLANAKEKNIFKNINKYKLITLDGLDNSYTWFKYLIYKNKYKNIQEKDHLFFTKENKIIYNIFFNQKSLGVITKVAYDTMIELNPQLKKKVKIIKKSDKIFISFLGFSHFNITKEETEYLYSFSSKIKDFLGDSQLASTSNISISHSFDKHKIKKLEDFHRKYIRLKNNYIKDNTIQK